MNLIYLFLLLLFLGANSCQKDKDVFEESIEEEIANNLDETENDENTDEESGDGPQTDDGDGKDDGEQILKAFPSAYGGGSNASGGRGKRAFFVTNLNDSGPGSFRQALLDAGNNDGGNVIFTVSGTIELKTRTYFSFNNVTIAGQTAPEGGIDLTGKGIAFEECNNVIIRYIRFRPDYAEFDAASFIGCKNLIIDHCSLSWGGDETISFWSDTDNITMQNLLIAEGKTGTILGDSDNPSLSENLSLHNSLFYNISHRFPNPNSNDRIDVINNVVYNWKYRLLTPTGNVKLNHINNYYALGCLTNITGLENKIFEGDTPSIHTSGNYVDKGILTQSKQNNWVLWRSFYANAQAPTSFNVFEPYPLIGNPLPIVSAEEAFDHVLNDVGANRTLDLNGNVINYQDSLDKMFIENVRLKTCVNYQSSSFGQNYNTTDHYNTYHASVSNTPVAQFGSNADSDFDGMPDVWEVRNFGDLSRSGLEDMDGDGYSDLEEYLNIVDSQ